MLGTGPTAREIDQIAEFADSSIRAIVPEPAPAGPRAGSLPSIKGRRGLNDLLYRKWGNTGNAMYTFIGSLLTILVAGGAAWLLDEPWLFPSLGATCFLFFETPMAEVSSPRNTVLGHYVGGAVAYFWLVVFSLTDTGSAIDNMDAERAIAIALSLGFTGGILRLMRAAHPPAGATTVIVSIGLLDTPEDMLALANGVILVVLVAGILNRVMGVPAPVWDTPYRGLRGRLHTGAGPRREGGVWVTDDLVGDAGGGAPPAGQQPPPLPAPGGKPPTPPPGRPGRG